MRKVTKKAMPNFTQDKPYMSDPKSNMKPRTKLLSIWNNNRIMVDPTINPHRGIC